MATQTITSTSTSRWSHLDLPPFPTDVPTAPLLQLDLHKLLTRDPREVRRFIRACEDLGFFYLDLTGDPLGKSILKDADALFGVGEELLGLPLEEKSKYDFSGQKSYFGYKSQGAAVVDKKGNLDRNEFYNVSEGEEVWRETGLTIVSRCQRMTFSVCRIRFPLRRY